MGSVGEVSRSRRGGDEEAAVRRAGKGFEVRRRRGEVSAFGDGVAGQRPRAASRGAKEGRGGEATTAGGRRGRPRGGGGEGIGVDPDPDR